MRGSLHPPVSRHHRGGAIPARAGEPEGRCAPHRTRAPPKPSVDLHEVYFEFNSAEITAEAEPQLRELGAALSDPRLKGSTISIGGHTDAVGGDAFNQRLSERRAATIKWYLVDNFRLPATNLHAVGYGKQRPKNKADLFAPENRRVEIVNETPRTQAQR